MPKVWSELKQSGPATDCVYSATLMVLVGSGFDRFPMGMYSDAERNALESSNAIADGSITITVSERYPLAEAARAHTDLQGRRTVGSVVLVP